ncbi:Uma2 family endonuclease [Synechocystis sp. PCC 7509]|uniref:Uma2 family endonuclease n=1 Tax=Synechocystis sp. PCC 7509 TaxID=927677 RepID=UPI0002ACB0F5|nr:Uma2 family endonuclease [Synechocystis sp. PCC 7509]
MTAAANLSVDQDIIYPDSDGQPMSDNTKQFEWIVTIKGGLDALYKDDPNVFVAGDLLWYPVYGNNKLRVAPDTMVAFGRPKGYRGSYKQWLEDNIAPQVVFEILSPGNTLKEMAKKLEFYEVYSVEEYYLYDLDKNDLRIWNRVEGRLTVVEVTPSWVSPRLGIRFELNSETMQIYRPDGRPFATYVELDRQRETAEQHASDAQQRAETAEKRAEELAAKLRALGIDPDA